MYIRFSVLCYSRSKTCMCVYIKYLNLNCFRLSNWLSVQLYSIYLNTNYSMVLLFMRCFSVCVFYAHFNLSLFIYMCVSCWCVIIVLCYVLLYWLCLFYVHALMYVMPFLFLMIFVCSKSHSCYLLMSSLVLMFILCSFHVYVSFNLCFNTFTFDVLMHASIC